MFYDGKIEEWIRHSKTELTSHSKSGKKVYFLRNKFLKLSEIYIRYTYSSFIGFRFNELYEVRSEDVFVPTKDAKKLFKLVESIKKDKEKAALERRTKYVLEKL